MLISEFCKIHSACPAGRNYAESTGCTTMEELWGLPDLPHSYRLWIFTREGVAHDKALRMFACACVRGIWHLLTDERSKNAVIVAEQYANGKATQTQLDRARAAAGAAAWDSAYATAYAAAYATAWNTTRNAAMDAARAAMDAARDATRATAWDAAKDAQNKLMITYEVKFHA